LKYNETLRLILVLNVVDSIFEHLWLQDGYDPKNLELVQDEARTRYTTAFKNLRIRIITLPEGEMEFLNSKLKFENSSISILPALLLISESVSLSSNYAVQEQLTKIAKDHSNKVVMRLAYSLLSVKNRQNVHG